MGLSVYARWKARYLGLGSANTVRLAAARGLAGQTRQQLQNGVDPIEARKQAVVAARAATAKSVQFKEFAESVVDAQETGWKNAKHRQQWRNTLKTHVYPKLGHRTVASITTDDVLSVLQPIWTATPETASRIRGRIETILDAAKARGVRSGENPARWCGHLSNLLPKASKIARITHHPALPFSKLPAFMAQLRGLEGISPRALELTILTAARTCEVLGMRWTEVDLQQKLWVVPPERMKAGKEHRVPLCARAIEILKELEAVKLNEFVFPGFKPGRHLSDMSLLMLLRRMDQDKITVHGFRSTFRDWAAETTSFPNHVVEMALAHTVANQVESAYRRGDLFEKRRKLMAAWERYSFSRSSVVEFPRSKMPIENTG